MKKGVGGMATYVIYDRKKDAQNTRFKCGSCNTELDPTNGSVFFRLHYERGSIIFKAVCRKCSHRAEHIKPQSHQPLPQSNRNVSTEDEVTMRKK